MVRNNKYVWRFFLALGIMAAATWLTGCASFEKQKAKFHSFAYLHPEVLAEDCAKLFPAKDSVGKPVITSVVKADNKDYSGQIDSLQRHADSLQNVVEQAALNKEDPCAPVAARYQKDIAVLNGKIRILAKNYEKCKSDTVKFEVPVYRTDMAKETVWQERMRDMTLQRDKALKERDDYHSSRNTWRWIVIIAGGVIVIGLVLRFVLARFTLK